LADRLYAKKNKAAREEETYKKLLEEEEDEIADEYRGLPYEERLKVWMLYSYVLTCTRNTYTNVVYKLQVHTQYFLYYKHILVYKYIYTYIHTCMHA